MKNKIKNKQCIESKELSKAKKFKDQKAITLIALVITTIFSYDEKLKCSNYNGFLLETI